jgi:hypothetical protein
VLVGLLGFVLSKKFLFWAPTVGFGHLWSRFSATFRQPLKSIGDNILLATRAGGEMAVVVVRVVVVRAIHVIYL